MNETTASPLLVRLWKESDRPIAEQLVGLGVIAMSCLAFAFIGSFLIDGLFLFTLVHSTTALSFWTLWRRNPLQSLKLELSLFLSSFFFESTWFISLYGFHQLLLALMALLFWMVSALCCTALFWKKEKRSAQLFIPLLLWIFYQVSVNMVLCISKF